MNTIETTTTDTAVNTADTTIEDVVKTSRKAKAKKARKAAKAAKAKYAKGAKAKKAAKGKGAKKGAKGAKAKNSKKKPTTGQSAPHEDVKFDELNDKELKLVTAINGEGSGARQEISIPQLVKVFSRSADTDKQANSWVRNSLRRLVTGEYVEKLARGIYRVTDKGRKRLQRAEA